MGNIFSIIAVICAISGMILTALSLSLNTELWMFSSFSWNGASLFYWAYKMVDENKSA